MTADLRSSVGCGERPGGMAELHPARQCCTRAGIIYTQHNIEHVNVHMIKYMRQPHTRQYKQTSNTIIITRTRQQHVQVLPCLRLSRVYTTSCTMSCALRRYRVSDVSDSACAPARRIQQCGIEDTSCRRYLASSWPCCAACVHQLVRFNRFLKRRRIDFHFTGWRVCQV